MSYSRHVNNIYKSTVLIMTNLIDQLVVDNVSSPSFLNLDAHAEISEWPDTDVVGMAGFSLDIHDTANVVVTTVFFSSTVNDPNLFRHIEIMDRIVDQIIPMRTHPLVDAETGDVINWMTVAGGTQLLRMERTESRPIQYAMAQFQTGLTYSPYKS